MNSKVQVKFTAGQAKKLKAGHKKGNSVSVRLTNNQLFHPEGVHVEVSEVQHKKMLSAKKSKGKRGYTLVLSPTQIGGFLQFLIPLLPAIGEALLTGAAASAGAEAVGAISRAIQGKGQGGSGHCCSGGSVGGDLTEDIAKLQKIIMDELVKESRRLTGQKGGDLESYLVRATDTKSMQKSLMDWLISALKKAVGLSSGSGLFPLGVSGRQKKKC